MEVDKYLAFRCPLRHQEKLYSYALERTRKGLLRSITTKCPQWVAQLEAISSLEGLIIVGVNVDDGCGPSLAKLRSLKRLSLARSAVGDGVIPEISKLARLERLDMSRTNITDKGLLQIHLSKLKMLDLRNTSVTEDGIKEFLRQAPTDIKVLPWPKSSE